MNNARGGIEVKEQGMMRKGLRWLAAGWMAGMMVAAAPAQERGFATDGLRHAVVCPPFKGPAELAGLYHAEMVKMLQETEHIEYLEGARALARRAPEFTFRVMGEIVEGEDGQVFVTVSLVDAARKEQIASHVAPASSEKASIAAWKKTIQKDMQRRASKLPFECRIRRKAGQSSYSLDRGLGSGLQPGMVLYVAVDEEMLISPYTGEVIGRDSPRAMGQIEVFRVMENTAYARPVAGTQVPRTGKLYARTF
jgi:hypothetical protein